MNLDNYPTFKDFMLSELKEDIEAISYTYYSKTSILYEKYHDEIWKKLATRRAYLCYKNIMELISDFDCVENINSDATFKNALVWFMAEETAREIFDNQQEESKHD